MKNFSKLLIILLLVSYGELSAQQPVKYTARKHVTAAVNYARNNFDANASLFAVNSFNPTVELDTTGKAFGWFYYFYKPNSTDTVYVVSIVDLGIIIFPAGTATTLLPAGFVRRIDTAFCNSDLALTVTENAGGRQFRYNNPGATITATINKFPLAPDTSKSYWTIVYADSANNQIKVFFLDGTSCEVVTIGINPISTEVPGSFMLYQNYPNPFNPSTKIRFDIPRSEYVRIRVFDLLGKELAELVSEKLGAGTYETDFDGSQYPSGAYFYSLEAGDIRLTKKMLLIK